MARACLNVLLRLEGGTFRIEESLISPTPGWRNGPGDSAAVWATVYEAVAPTYEQAQTEIEFMLDRGDLRQIPALVKLKELTEKSLGRRIGTGTIDELMPPGSDTLLARVVAGRDFFRTEGGIPVVRGTRPYHGDYDEVDGGMDGGD